MKKLFKLILSLKDEAGVVTIIVAASIVALVGFAALAVDVGYMMVTRNELQNVSDGAALAATRQIGIIYEGKTLEEQNTYTADPLEIKPVAQGVAEKNQAGGKDINIADKDIKIGQWNGVTQVFTETLDKPDAVRVTSRRDDTDLADPADPDYSNGSISTIFARVFGTDNVEVTAEATAALTSLSTIGEGELLLPVGLSSFRFEDGNFCGEDIRFYPTNDPASCGGWHVFTEPVANAPVLEGILTDIENGVFNSPDVIAGETQFSFTGGTLTSVFEEMQSLFEANRDPPVTGTWKTTVVVYEGSDCSNPNQTLTIVGFAVVEITTVESVPDKFIEGIITCGFIDNGRGGGANFGTKGSIPNLVK